MSGNIKSKRSYSPKLNRKAWTFVLPGLALIILFVFYPMIQAFITSFQTGAGNQLTFNGIVNYKRLFNDLTFRKALTNTLLVMSLIYRFFGSQYAAASGEAANAAYLFILSIIGINGVPEAIVAGILLALLGRVLMNEKVRANIGV